MIFYFSGTGNSLKVAKDLSCRLEDSIQFIDGTKNPITINDEIIGFVFPVYYYDAPEFIIDFIKQLNIPKNAYIYAVTTCGGNGGNALYSVSGALQEKGLSLSYAKALTMPDNTELMYDTSYGNIYTNLVVLFDNSGREIKLVYDYSSLEHYDEILSRIAKDIAQRSVNIDEVAFSEATKKRSDSAKQYDGFTTKYVDADKCIKCGQCQTLCPVGNIKLNENGVLIGENCVSCFACAHWCPKAAISFKCHPMIIERQYHHPEITVEDMISNR